MNFVLVGVDPPK